MKFNYLIHTECIPSMLTNQAGNRPQVNDVHWKNITKKYTHVVRKRQCFLSQHALSKANRSYHLLHICHNVYYFPKKDYVSRWRTELPRF